ncbi:MAG: MBL fold metallo-hydrolase [Eubacteriales bacterium]|nr:MBL fold metallo-hydrolase [Eubacteriales bacterium]
MALSLTPLFSGSSGNAILICSERTKILVDAGVSGKRLEQALLSIGENIRDIKGILITHEHSDHIQGAGILSRKHDIPVYATEPTWLACGDKLGSVHSRLTRIISKNAFYIDDLLIEPYDIPHDAADPVGYCVSRGTRKVAVATDLGHFSKTVEYRLHACDLVLLEANHDSEMLAAGKYPYELKQRIKSRHGHLSNEDAADAALRLAAAGVSSILLGHLSKENNLEQLAFRTVTDTLLQGGITPGRDISLGLAFRDRVTGVFSIK